MNLQSHLLILFAVALLTPVAAILGLYETSMEQVLRFLGPVSGAATAVAFARLFRRR